MSASEFNPREIVQVHINPHNGTVLALARDGSLWMRDGHLVAAEKPWRRIPNLPPVTPIEEESEDDITTVV